VTIQKTSRAGSNQGLVSLTTTTHTTKESNMSIWSVMVDGTEVNDYYLTLEHAQVLALTYQEDGYSDVYISAEGA
jgi:hypothetical protein